MTWRSPSPSSRAELDGGAHTVRHTVFSVDQRSCGRRPESPTGRWGPGLPATAQVCTRQDGAGGTAPALRPADNEGRFLGRPPPTSVEPASCFLMDSRLTVVGHPSVAQRLGQLRDEGTGRDRFRNLMAEISMFLAYEALADLSTSAHTIRTPVGPGSALAIEEEVLVVPILRAGLGMVPGVQQVAPNCEVAHLGLKRNEETLDAVCYLDGLPADLSARRAVVCDPMLATGGSLAQACRLIASRGAARITALCLVASEPGLRSFSAQMPEVHVVCAAVDAALDQRGYIVPGLGDAGDRLFGPPGDGLMVAARTVPL